MRKNLFLVGLLFFGGYNFIFSQQFDWTSVCGSWAYDYGYGITTDNSGCVYVTGKFELNANFSGVALSSRGNHDMFLAKYSSAGSLLWIKSCGGIYGDYSTAIALNGSYLYVAGEIEGYGNLITFDDSPQTLQVCGDNDVFLAKYDLNGSLIWAQSAGGFQSDKALGISVDGNGNVLVCGYYTDSISFSGNNYLLGNGNRDIFIAKYDSSGNFVWSKSMGSYGRDEAKSIVCDVVGNVFVTGMFSHIVNFGGTSLTSPNGYYDMFFCKLDPQGNLIWAKQGSSTFDEVGWGITMDSNGKIYVAGEFNAYAVFDAFAVTTNGMSDFFVACYDFSGNVIWVKNGGGNLVERARGIGTDGQNVYVTGQFGGQMQLGSTILHASDSSDIFVASLDASGNFMWALSVGGNSDSLEQLGYESGNAICSDPLSNSVYITGALLNGGVFGTDTIGGFTRTDIFVSKISQLQLHSELNYIYSYFSILPNPAENQFQILRDNLISRSEKLNVFDLTGHEVFSTDKCYGITPMIVSTSNWSAGIYFVKLTTSEGIFTQPVFINH